jgi:hypothetical protein
MLAFARTKPRNDRRIVFDSLCEHIGNLAGRQLVDDGVILLQWAERKYGGSQLDWLFQKDQVTRIQFKSLRVRD